MRELSTFNDDATYKEKTVKHRLVCVFATCAGLYGQGALAIDNLKINGFMTAGASAIDSKSNATQDGLMEDKIGFKADNRLGLQVTAKINPQVDFNGQLFAQAREENYNVHTDWAYITYRPLESLQVRAGLNKLPNFLISDYQWVGYAYPWIRPPQEIYTQNPLESASGVHLIFKQPVGDAQLLIQPYFGRDSDEVVVPQDAIINNAGGGLTTYTAGKVGHIEFDSDPVKGLDLSLITDTFTVRAGHQTAKVNLEFDTPSEGDNWRLTTLGFTMDRRNVVLYTEYFQRKVDGNANAIWPNQKGYYATLGYRMGKFLPHFTAAKLDDNKNASGANIGTPLKQTSQTLGLRYEVGSGAALKFEFGRAKPEDGTRGLFVNVPDKSTVKIYGAAIDVVF